MCYRITPSSDFAGVEAECKRNFRGSLVSVHDSKENAFIATLVRTSHAVETEFYIGLTRNFTGHWTWLDDSPVNYTAWKSDESGGNGTIDHCVQVTTKFGPTSGRWGVVSCDEQRPAVCQRDLTDLGEEGGEPEGPFTGLKCPAGYICGNGTITSPNYPQNYDRGQDVTYHLVASWPGSVVVLWFGTIEIINGADFITVYDGADHKARVLEM